MKYVKILIVKNDIMRLHIQSAIQKNIQNMSNTVNYHECCVGIEKMIFPNR